MNTIYVIVAIFATGTQEYRGDPQKPWTTHEECRQELVRYLPTIQSTGGFKGAYCEPRHNNGLTKP